MSADVHEIADRLIEDEHLGKHTPLPATWCPGDECPNTGDPCSSWSCYSNEQCALRPTLTSRLAAEGGRHLAKWAADAGADGMCPGCAFREGTRANRTDGTIIDVANCTLTGEPFYCHEGLKHGEKPNRVCRGWEAITRKHRR